MEKSLVQRFTQKCYLGDAFNDHQIRDRELRFRLVLRIGNGVSVYWSLTASAAAAALGYLRAACINFVLERNSYLVAETT